MNKILLKGLLKRRKIMNIKIFLALILCNISILTACGENQEKNNNIHNETIGLYTSVNDDVYYVNNDILFKYTDGYAEELSNNVISIQRQDDKIYCIYTENHFDYSLYEITDDKLEWLLDLNSGTYQQSAFYKNKLYVCINNEITIYNLQTMENEKLSTGNLVTRFVVDSDNLYYWSVDLADVSMDSYVNSIKNGEEARLFEGRLYSYDLNTNTYNELAHGLAAKDMFFISPTKYGVVFYNPERLTVNIYNNSVETLYKGEILNMLTDDNKIYFLSNDNKVYKLDIKTKDIDILVENVSMIKGMDNKYIFSGDDCILIKD